MKEPINEGVSFAKALSYDIEKSHCTKCGAKMQMGGIVPAERWFPLLDAFDGQTGERLYKKIYNCPRSRWWNRGHSELWDTGYYDKGGNKI